MLCFLNPYITFLRKYTFEVKVMNEDFLYKILFQEDRLVTLGQNRIQVDYGQVSSGLYLLRVDDGQHISTVKVLVE